MGCLQDNDAHNYLEESERGSARDAPPSRGLLQLTVATLFDATRGDSRQVAHRHTLAALSY